MSMFVSEKDQFRFNTQNKLIFHLSTPRSELAPGSGKTLGTRLSCFKNCYNCIWVKSHLRLCVILSCTCAINETCPPKGRARVYSSNTPHNGLTLVSRPLVKGNEDAGYGGEKTRKKQKTAPGIWQLLSSCHLRPQPLNEEPILCPEIW